MWQRFAAFTSKSERVRTICADCGMPQPDDPNKESLHLEECPAHNEKFCIVCKKATKRRTICADCGCPQPNEGSLHFEDCPAHNPKFCVVCKRAKDKVSVREGE